MSKASSLRNLLGFGFPGALAELFVNGRPEPLDLTFGATLLTTLNTAPSYDDDTAAASGGVALGQIYRNGNFLMVRIS